MQDLQLEQTSFNIDSIHDNNSSNNTQQIHHVGRAVIRQFKSPHVLLSLNEQSSQDLKFLTHCQVCQQPFTQPTTLPCGFTACYQCLPATKPYQCLSFSCLRTHNNNYQPNRLLRDIISQFNSHDDKDDDKLASIKSLLDCSICLSPFVEPITTECGHTFCKECLIRTMTDLKTRSCPFCRYEISRLGKVNQLVCGWLDYIDNKIQTDDYQDDAMGELTSEPRSTPIIQAFSTIVLPNQHCLFNVAEDRSQILQQMTAKPHMNHYAICVFSKESSCLACANDVYEYATMLQLNHVEHSPDGRYSVVQAVGLFQLRIDYLTLMSKDCYTGSVTRLEDVADTSDEDTTMDDPREEHNHKRWTMPTSSISTMQTAPIMTASTSSGTSNSNMGNHHSHLCSKPMRRKLTRPRPCSMRLSSSAPNHTRFTMNDTIPGSTNRRTWATAMNYGKVPSSPPPFNHLQSQPKSIHAVNSSTNSDMLFNQEIQPNTIEPNNTWHMQNDYFLQQSD